MTAPLPRGALEDKSEEKELLDLFAQDHEKAWRQFLGQFSSFLRETIRWRLGRGGDHDQVEDVYVRIVEKLHEDGSRRVREFRRLCRFRTWLTSIVINQTRDEMAAAARHRLPTTPIEVRNENGKEEITIPDKTGSPLDEAIRRESVQSLRKCMERLSPEERLRLARRFEDRLALREIADLEATSTGAIDGRIRKTLQELKACIEKTQKIEEKHV